MKFLSKHEELDLLKEFINGDDTNFVKYFNPVIQIYIKRTLKRIYGHNYNMSIIDDLIQNTWISLCAKNRSALKNFKPSNEGHLRSYIHRSAISSIHNFFRKPINKLSPLLYTENDKYAPMYTSKIDEFIEFQNIEYIVSSLFKSKTLYEKNILLDLTNDTGNEIERKYGIKKQLAYHKKYKLLKKLKNRLVSNKKLLEILPF